MAKKYLGKGTPILLFICIVFSLFSIGLGIGFGGSILKNNSLAKNAPYTDVPATVTGMNSNTTINNVPYYYLTYTYVHEGQTFNGRTSSAYTLNDAGKLQETQSLRIRHDGNGNSIQDDYTVGSDALFLIIPGVFGLVSIGLLIGVFVSLKNYFNAKAIIRDGRQGRGRMIAYNSTVRVNGVPYFRIEFACLDSRNNQKTVKTPSVFTYREALYLESLGEFAIKFNDKTAIIVEDLVPARGFAVPNMFGAGLTGGNNAANNAGQSPNSPQTFGAPQEDPLIIQQQNAELFKILQQKIEKTRSVNELNELMDDIRLKCHPQIYNQLSVIARFQEKDLTRR